MNILLYKIKIIINKEHDYLSYIYFMLRHNKENNKYYWFDLTLTLELDQTEYDNVENAEKYLDKLVENNIIISWFK